MNLTNLFADLPEHLPDELFQTLIQTPSLRIERIVSRGHTTPVGQWYDQDTEEWVVLLQGAAKLCIEGRDGLLSLRAGDAVLLPAHQRHRVEWTDPERYTIWLAVLYPPSA
jgi:cupin 2 domain-containing protein